SKVQQPSARERAPMTSDTLLRPVSPLRARMIEDMTVRGFNEHTRRDYVRHVRSFAAFISRSPDTATAEDLRLFQLRQTRLGLPPASIHSSVSALRFFFTVTLDRPVLSRRLTVVPQPHNRSTNSPSLCHHSSLHHLRRPGRALFQLGSAKWAESPS